MSYKIRLSLSIKILSSALFLVIMLTEIATGFVGQLLHNGFQNIRFGLNPDLSLQEKNYSSAFKLGAVLTAFFHIPFLFK